MAKKDKAYPDHASNMNRINRIMGQLEGIKRMIEEKRYCPEILTQTRAISSALRALETAILEKHLHHCVTSALEGGSRKEIDGKLNELLTLFKRSHS